MSLFKDIFLPDGRKFYTLFDEVADNLKQMNRYFSEAIYDNSYLRAGYIRQMKELESANDDVSHKLYMELGKNFITPFDREDIYTLTAALDDIIDYMWSSVRLMKNYNIEYADRVAQVFADYNGKIIKLLSDAVKALKNKDSLPKIAPACSEMKKLINASDNLMDNAFSTLFTQGNCAMDTIKRYDHYYVLQSLLEKCNDAVNVIESVIIKYS